MVYLVLLGVGFAGIMALGAFSFAHGVGQHGHHGAHGHTAGHDVHSGHAAHGSAHTHVGPHHGGSTGHAHAGAHHGHSHTGSQDNSMADGDADGDAGDLGAATALVWLMPYLSPLNWFSWFTGAGAAGAIAQAAGVPEPMRAGIAVLGAITFNRGLVRPIWNFVFQFASAPAGNLDSCLSQSVEAVTTFSAQGEGLVRVTIDGRTEDILARLAEKDRGGPRVRKGDHVVIEEVFPRTNSCRVSRA